MDTINAFPDHKMDCVRKIIISMRYFGFVWFGQVKVGRFSSLGTGLMTSLITKPNCIMIQIINFLIKKANCSIDTRNNAFPDQKGKLFYRCKK